MLRYLFFFKDSFLYIVLRLHNVLFIYSFIDTFFILKAREDEMTAKVVDLQTQLKEFQQKYEQRLQQEDPGNDKVRGIRLCITHFLQTLSSLLFDIPASVHIYPISS